MNQPLLHWRWSLLIGVAVAAALWIGACAVASSSTAAATHAPLAAISPFPPPLTPTPHLALPGEDIDLDVTFINRAPMYHAYCVIYSGATSDTPGIPVLCPGTEDEQRWPLPGEVVTFTAHIVNKGSAASGPFGYLWQIDGAEVFSGALPGLAPAQEVTVSYPWAWAHMMAGERVLDDHTVGFTVDPANAVSETHENNNALVDYTNAMSLRIGFTPEMYAAYNLPVAPLLPRSAEDWAQKQIAAMNDSFARSVYPAAPAERTLRVRINSIEVHETDPGYDYVNDGGWFLNYEARCDGCGYYDPETDIDWGLVHELSHQVGLIDLYASNIYAYAVDVLDQDGNPANMGFEWPAIDLMFGGSTFPYNDPHLYSSHSAGGAASNKGYRNGYYGAYQFDIPQQNYLQILDSQGNPAAGVQVSLYQRAGGEAGYIGHQGIDNTAEFSGVTGEDGRLALPNRSAQGGATTRTGHVLRDNPFGLVDIIGVQNRFLARIHRADHEEFAWLDITAFNLAYWEGSTLTHTLTITSHLPVTGAPPAPESLVLRVEGETATLCWQPVPAADVAAYRVFRAAPPDYTYTPAADLPSGEHCFSEYLPGVDRVYAVSALDAQQRQSGFSRFAWAPHLSLPAALVVRADGSRVILFPFNAQSLLRQRADGRYHDSLGGFNSMGGDRFYYHPNSRFLAVDANDYLIISQPGDTLQIKPTVEILALDGTSLLTFGSLGMEPGQFITPTGVAHWQSACAACAPIIFVADSGSHRVQAFDAGGNFVAAFGSQGSGDGQFDEPQGVAVDGEGRVWVVDRGNDRIVALRFDGQSFAYEASYHAGFDAPAGIVVDALGHIYIADTGNHRIVELDAAGAFLAEYTTPVDGSSGPLHQPLGVAVDAGGAIIVADSGNERVVVVRKARAFSIMLPLVSQH